MVEVGEAESVDCSLYVGTWLVQSEPSVRQAFMYSTPTVELAFLNLTMIPQAQRLRHGDFRTHPKSKPAFQGVAPCN